MKSVSLNRNTAKGFSLIELLLVLGVLAILLVAAFVVYPQVRDRNQANSEVSNLTSIKANINNLYASRGGNYGNLTTGIANQARAFPGSMNNNTFDAGQAVTSSWGEAVTVTANAAAVPLATGSSLAAGRSFNISYANVPAGVCLGLVSGAASNFPEVKVAGATVFDANGFNPGTAAGACANGGTVVFTSN